VDFIKALKANTVKAIVHDLVKETDKKPKAKKPSLVGVVTG
jgi:hypothetical protein